MLASNVKTVRNDMKTLMRDAQALLREAASATGEKADELRARGMQLLDAAMAKAHEVQTMAMEAGKEVVESTDDFVKKNPWTAVGIAAGVGFLFGLALRK